MGEDTLVRDWVIWDGKQAGVYVHYQGQGTIEKCEIHGNAYAGLPISTAGNPVVREYQDPRQEGCCRLRPRARTRHDRKVRDPRGT